MPALDDRTFAVLGLCSRLVPADDAEPLKAKEFWALIDRVNDPGTLVGRSAEDLRRDGFRGEDAERYVSLLDRAGALALALEELEQAGIWTLAAGDEAYPRRLKDQLGPQAPPILHGAGPAGLMTGPSLGVVGSRNVDEDGAEVARSAARLAVEHGMTLVSGGASGVDQLAMAAALDAGGSSAGVLAESLTKRLRESEVRRVIHDERLCLVTPYKPDAGFSVGNAMGRNKLIYALSDVTLVVASDHESGGTWAGATEALRTGAGAVAVWRGPGEGPGNESLADRGATQVRSVEDLLQRDPPAVTEPAAEQLGFGLG
jgi:predicted Rossmann fold nucleotide-binding protein DprA/Smf involved in DNA uptake